MLSYHISQKKQYYYNWTGTELHKRVRSGSYALGDHQALIIFDAAYEAFIADPSLPCSIFQIDGANIWMKCPGEQDSWRFFNFLLTKAQIIGTPGAGFGECGEGYFRFSSFGNPADTEEVAIQNMNVPAIAITTPISVRFNKNLPSIDKAGSYCHLFYAMI